MIHFLTNRTIFRRKNLKFGVKWDMHIFLTNWTIFRRKNLKSGKKRPLAEMTHYIEYWYLITEFTVHCSCSKVKTFPRNIKW